MPKVFAYGAIMNDEASKQNGQRGFVRDHIVRFSVRGIPFIEPRFAGLHPAPGETAWGVLIEMTEKDWKYFRRAELSYYHEEVVVITDDGEETEAWAFFVKDKNIAPEKPPSARYAKLLHMGADHHDLPEHIVTHYKTLHDTGNKFSLFFWFMKPVVVPVLRIFRS